MAEAESISLGEESSKGLTFRASQRLSRSRDYQAVYQRGMRKVRGPLMIVARPNGSEVSRLGLSVGRRVGGAITRNRIKRLLRESFRLSQHELPPGYDLVINVRPHAPLSLDDYRKHLVSACASIARDWSRRR